MGCRFFFEQVRTRINDKFPNLLGEGEDPTASIAAKKTISGYGWLNSLYEVAKDNVFTKGWEYNPIDSVLNTKLYEVLTYLSWKAACAKFETVYSDLNSKMKK